LATQGVPDREPIGEVSGKRLSHHRPADGGQADFVIQGSEEYFESRAELGIAEIE
jgi:hypothetical protein